MTTISDKIGQPAMEKLGGYQYVEGPKFEMPQQPQAGKPEQQGMSQTEQQVFEDGMKRLGLYDMVRHLNYPIV